MMQAARAKKVIFQDVDISMVAVECGATSPHIIEHGDAKVLIMCEGEYDGKSRDWLLPVRFGGRNAVAYVPFPELFPLNSPRSKGRAGIIPALKQLLRRY